MGYFLSTQPKEIGLWGNDEDLNRGKKRKISGVRLRLINGESNPHQRAINRFNLKGYLAMGSF